MVDAEEIMAATRCPASNTVLYTGDFITSNTVVSHHNEESKLPIVAGFPSLQSSMRKSNVKPRCGQRDTTPTLLGIGLYHHDARPGCARSSFSEPLPSSALHGRSMLPACQHATCRTDKRKAGVISSLSPGTIPA